VRFAQSHISIPLGERLGLRELTDPSTQFPTQPGRRRKGNENADDRGNTTCAQQGGYTAEYCSQKR
jgi:hypothetical protein